ncbi:MAG: F0F1 ATP synthase subunit A [Anaerolineae bacterium]|nr:F0F1 ATP synthase subunit A [Anaerolineae bacterium]
MKGLLRLLLILLVAALLCGLPVYLLPLLEVPVAFPHVQVPAEALTEQPLFSIGSQPFYITNTLITTLIADAVLLLLALIAGRAAAKRLKRYDANPKAVDEEGTDYLVPKKGIHNLFETLVEYLYDLVEQIIGHRDKKTFHQVFALVATIFFFVLTANWLHFIPGVDSVGIVHCADADKGMKGFGVVPIGEGVYRLDMADGEIPRTGELSTAACPEHHGEAESADEGAEEHIDESGLRYVITPYLRTATTDLNLTLAIALVAVVGIQFFGVKSSGMAYFTKFINLPALEKGFLGYIFFGAGFIEIISEIAKIISFALRLFGNLFAGTILLFVMAFLIPVGVPIIFYLLEVFVGLIQAFVFAMLTLIFIGTAMAGHDAH